MQKLENKTKKLIIETTNLNGCDMRQKEFKLYLTATVTEGLKSLPKDFNLTYYTLDGSIEACFIRSVKILLAILITAKYHGDINSIQFYKEIQKLIKKTFPTIKQDYE